MMLICRMEILSRSGSTVIPPHLGYRLMKSYRVLVLCDYCDRAHPTGITLDLDDDLSNKQTVAEAFKDKRMPPVINKLQRNAILCRESGMSVMLTDPGKIYLVPIA
jgi:hypothetical protein